MHKAFGVFAPGQPKPHVKDEYWRLASITKQVTAVEAMQAVDRGDLKLEDSLESSLGPALKGVTLQMLLQHHSGLANPDDTPAGDGQMPSGTSV